MLTARTLKDKSGRRETTSWKKALKKKTQPSIYILNKFYLLDLTVMCA